MLGINGAELVVLAVIAAVVVGPERLPTYAEHLARWARALRSTAATTRGRLADELGEDDIDWAALDPRRYDPRRIVQEALAGPGPVASSSTTRASAGPVARAASAGEPAPYDDEAT